jgi:hypothetical protein
MERREKIARCDTCPHYRAMAKFCGFWEKGVKKTDFCSYHPVFLEYPALLIDGD